MSPRRSGPEVGCDPVPEGRHPGEHCWPLARLTVGASKRRDACRE